jgi:hypothetical protein
LRHCPIVYAQDQHVLILNLFCGIALVRRINMWLFWAVRLCAASIRISYGCSTMPLSYPGTVHFYLPVEPVIFINRCLFDTKITGIRNILYYHIFYLQGSNIFNLGVTIPKKLVSICSPLRSRNIFLKPEPKFLDRLLLQVGKIIKQNFTKSINFSKKKIVSQL